jgi:hypothetical protein
MGSAPSLSADRPSDEWRAAFVYVPADDVPLIRANGFKCARRLYEDTGRLDTSKYEPQMQSALEKYGKELRSRFQTSDVKEQVLAYLDWRSDLPNASNAFYFMHAPVPQAVQEKLAERRGWDVRGMTLLRTWYNPRRVAVENIGGYADAYAWPRLKWESVWNKALDTDASLWLEGIPHAMFVPQGGMIPFEKFHILKRKWGNTHK